MSCGGKSDSSFKMDSALHFRFMTFRWLYITVTVSNMELDSESLSKAQGSISTPERSLYDNNFRL